MTVKIIYKNAPGDVTDEMLEAICNKVAYLNSINLTPTVYSLRSAMESARPKEIERIEVEQDEPELKIEIDCSEVMEHGEEGSIELIQRSNDLADQTHIIIVRGNNITDLANALLEMGKQIN